MSIRDEHVSQDGANQRWVASITFTVLEATVMYAALGKKAETFGVMQVSGNGTILRFSTPEASIQELAVSLTITGRPAAQVRAEATVWPITFDEVTATDGIIGIVWDAGADHRRGDVFLEPKQFDRLASLTGPSSKLKITSFLRPSVQPGYDLIERTDFNAVMVERQS